MTGPEYSGQSLADKLPDYGCIVAATIPATTKPPDGRKQIRPSTIPTHP